MGQMKKCILLVRVSTLRQDYSEQELQVEQMALSDGYSLDNIIPICEKESGRKLKFEERKGITEMLSLIESDNSIDAVYANDVDRIGRKQSVLHLVREYLEEHHINFIIRSINLRMYVNGEKNPMFDRYYSMLGQDAESEMNIKFERFKRGKLAVAKRNGFTGHTITFGYRYVNKEWVICEEEAYFVRKMFDLYVNKNYSQRRVYDELKKLGFNGSTALTQFGIHNPQYCGRKKESEFSPLLPPIITEELFDKAQELSNDRMCSTPKDERSFNILRGLIVCPYCGHLYSTCGEKLYTCVNLKARVNPCSENNSISRPTLDKKVFEIVSERYPWLAAKDNKKEISHIKDKIKDLEDKIKICDNKINEADKKLESLDDKWVSGELNDSRYNTLVKKVENSISEVKQNRKQYEQSIMTFNEQLNSYNNESILDFQNELNRNFEAVYNTKDFDTISAIIRRVIERIVPHKDPNDRYNKTIEFYLTSGVVLTYKLFPKKLKYEDKWVFVSEELKKEGVIHLPFRHSEVQYLCCYGLSSRLYPYQSRGTPPIMQRMRITHQLQPLLKGLSLQLEVSKMKQPTI